MMRYHGFTCPKCGSHHFGTHKEINPKDGREVTIGSCHARLGYNNPDRNNSCNFSWNRMIPQQEELVMYFQSSEEWDSSRGEGVTSDADELKIKIDELARMPVVTVEQVFCFREEALQLLRAQLKPTNQNKGIENV